MIPIYTGSNENLLINHRISKHVSPHMHHNIEFIYVTKGTLELGIGTEFFHMKDGDFAIVFPDTIHHYQVFSQGTNTAFYVEASISPHSQFAAELQKMCPVNPVIEAGELHPDVKNAILSLYKEKTRNPIVDQAFVQIILARCFPRMQLVDKNCIGDSDLVYQTVHYIADHFREELTLESIAKALGVNKFSLSRVFSGTFHTNFKQYLNEQRLNYACSLLEDTNRSVTDICLDSGFESQRTFNRVFVEKFHKTPREYRNDYKKRYMIPNEINEWEEKTMGNHIVELIKRFAEGQMDPVLKELYVSESLIAAQRVRYNDVLTKFETLFGEKMVEIYSAAGRSEIGGNHTDHQNGKVLAASINLDAIAVVAKREDDKVYLQSEGYEMLEIDLGQLGIVEQEKETTSALIRGVANGVRERGYEIGGFEAYVSSSVLTGSGLSSSAAFEVLIGNIFSGLYNNEMISAIEIAQIGQEAENNYFGKPCGLMDQMACSVGGMIYIDFADKTKPEVKKVDVRFSSFGHNLCIVDTKGSHADLTCEYAAIPEEMKKTAKFFGKSLLCEVNEAEFYAKLPELREVVGDRAVLRSIHWFAENKRVVAEAEALESGNFDVFKGLIKASGDSSYKYLQNVYSNQNVYEQNVSLALALSEYVLNGKGVCRVHGGGFAGTIQAFVPGDFVSEYKAAMEAVFGPDTCHVLQIRADGGRRVI